MTGDETLCRADPDFSCLTEHIKQLETRSWRSNPKIAPLLSGLCSEPHGKQMTMWQSLMADRLPFSWFGTYLPEMKEHGDYICDFRPSV